MSDFIGKLGSSLDKGLKTISAKGKEFVETAKLKSEIRDTEKVVDERFASMGRKAFEMVNQGRIQDDGLGADAREITDLYRKINELNEMIKKVEAEAAKSSYGPETVLCGGCKAPNRAGEAFCSGCGAPLPGQAPAVNDVVCPACGGKIKDGAKFCGNCGGKVG